MPAMTTPIDWTALARNLGTITREDEGGTSESGGTEIGRSALSAVLGEKELVLAVSHYLEGRPGSELVRSVLMLLRPPAAMWECYRDFRENTCIDARRFSLGLLGDIADTRVLPWIDEWIDDDDMLVSGLWAKVLEQLVYRDVSLHESEVQALLRKMDSHNSEKMRDYADEIRSILSNL